jgi:pimeloyl-ACP methyl ester carboxylesterase
MLEVAHRWLHIPYALHIHTNQKPENARATVLFLHGIGNSGAAWDEVVAKLPDDLHIISIDLLGFGKSPRPSWAVYDAKTQARSVLATFFKPRMTGPVILAGHSLGALVAVEIARRYPLLIKSLVLFSPPFYRNDLKKRRPTLNSDLLRRDLYNLVKKRPDQFIQIASLGLRLGLLNKAFSLTNDNTAVYMNALEASILNQTSLKDAAKLPHTPIRILYGRFDPVVVSSNLRYLAKQNPNVSITPVFASHEIIGPFVSEAVKAINSATDTTVIKHL